MSSKLNRLKKQMKAKEAFSLMNDENYEKAIELYADAIQLDPNDWRLFNNRSYCRQQLKQFNQALIDADTAIKLDETQIAGHYRKGCILLCLKLFRSAEKAFKNALNCDQNDENSKAKLTQTLRLFIKEFGFNDEREVDEITQLFDSCSAFIDALITGHLLNVCDFDNSCLISIESASKIPDESDLIKSVSISNELNFNFEDTEQENENLMPFGNGNNSSLDINSVNGLPNEDLIRWQTPDSMNEVMNDSNESMNGIRLPKSVPIFRKSPCDIKTIPTIEKNSPEISSVTKNSSCDETTPKKMVKTRPTIRRSIVND